MDPLDAIGRIIEKGWVVKTMGLSVMTFSHEVFVALASTQVEQQIAFYQALFSLVPTVRSSVYGEFRLPGLKLSIFEPGAAHASEFSAGTSHGPMSVCLEVSHLDNAIAHLTSLGYPPPGDVIHASHGQEIYAYDPDGNRLILHQAVASGG